MFWYDKKGSYNLLFLLSMWCYDFSCCVTKFNCHSKINGNSIPILNIYV